MATIEIPKVRKESTVIMYVSLTDNGVTVDWTSLSEIKPFMYSDEQHCIAGKCTAEIATGAPETLIVRYPTTAPQFLGQNSLLIRCTYDGNEKSFDVPVLEFVDRSSEATGVTVIEDPELPVAIEVQDVDTSVLDDAIAAALDAAAKATAAAELVPLDILAQCQAAAEAAEAAAENCAPVIGDNGNWWIYDYDAGEYVDSGKPSRGIQGEQGIQGIQGIQGNTGSSVDYPYELVNNRTTDDATKGLSAAEGKRLGDDLSQLEAEVDGINVNVGTWSVGSVNNPSGGHIPDYASNRRLRTAELTIQKTDTYFFQCNSGYKFGLIVVGKRESLIWDSELSIDLSQGDVYRIVLREEPDPTNTNIYQNYTQEQIDALVSASGFKMFVKSKFDELKEELETEINSVALSAIKSEQYCEIDVDIWPRPNSYISNGLIFFLDGKDFSSGTWTDKIGHSAFALTDCVKDGDGVKFNGTTSHGTTEDNLSFPSQSYTIEMVVKCEKEVSQSSDSQIIFNSKNSGDFALGFSMASNAKVYTFQAGTTNVNLGYKYTSALGVRRLSVNKNRCVENEEAITSGGGVGNWSVASKVVVGANSSATNWFFKGTIYAIRIYNRLLSESEMIANQMFDKDNYNL